MGRQSEPPKKGHHPQAQRVMKFIDSDGDARRGVDPRDLFSANDFKPGFLLIIFIYFPIEIYGIYGEFMVFCLWH